MTTPDEGPSGDGSGLASSADPNATFRLIARARAGDRDALDLLFARYGSDLQRFARGRLPQWARDLADTPDLVQEVLLRTFTQIEGFEDRGEGALRAYMRQALMNRIRDELRRASRRPSAEALSESEPDTQPSPLEAAIGKQAVERYESALASLPDEDRDLIVARLELGLSYAEIATATRRNSANAARMAVVRALIRLTDELGDAEHRE